MANSEGKLEDVPIREYGGIRGYYVTADIAAHILHYYGFGGYAPTDPFTQVLMSAIATADKTQRVKLSLGFPEYTLGMQCLDTDDSGLAGITLFQNIVAGKSQPFLVMAI